jgi:DNA-binding phage protein
LGPGIGLLELQVAHGPRLDRHVVGGLLLPGGNREMDRRSRTLNLVQRDPDLALTRRDLNVTFDAEVIMMHRKKTAFDRYFENRMKDPAFASAYKKARAIIDSTDTLIRALDKARLLAGVSKAELASRIEARPEIVRRLFTTKDSNPTLATVLKLVEALGFRLELVPSRKGSDDSAEART